MTDMYTDGNALAGPLMDIFAIDMTMAMGTCAHCGYHGSFAEMRVYDHSAGTVVRCSTCDQITMRLVKAPDRAWIDLRGVASLEIPLAAPTERA